MHRHGYKGRKFGRERDQRSALIKSLAEALIIQQSITTTLHKAKEIVPFVEKLITKAKKGDLHNRRQIISSLQTISSANKLVDEIAPKLTSRDSGHLRITKLANRRGDNAPMAEVSFVDDLTKTSIKSAKPASAALDKKIEKIAAPKKITEKKAATKKTTVSSTKKPAVTKKNITNKAEK
jgi:large subunit ribosomal protein L17